jgi:outer membrane protein TolC
MFAIRHVFFWQIPDFAPSCLKIRLFIMPLDSPPSLSVAACGLFCVLSTTVVGIAGEIVPGPADAGIPARLSLSKTIQLALQNNLGAKVEGLGASIADQRVAVQKAAFEPKLTLSGLFESSLETQNTRDFVATQNAANPRTDRLFAEENWRFSTGISGRIPYGTEYELTMDLDRLKNSLNIDRPPSIYYPEFESFAGLRVRQPLARDFGKDVQLAATRVAGLEREIAVLSWRRKVQTVVASSMKSYFDLVFAHEDIRVKSDNLDRARQLAVENRKRLEQGVGSELDVQQANAAAAVREEELIGARYFEREKANLLLRELVADFDITRRPDFQPIHQLSSSVPDLDPGRLMSVAVQKRIEYQQARMELAKQDIEIAYARNQTWPRVDLVGSFGLNGLSGGTGSSLSDAFDAQTPAWSVGISVTIPLGNREAKARMAESELRKEQLLLGFKQLEIDLALQVDTAAERVRTSRQRMDAAATSVTAAEATLDAEMKRLQQGVGVSFNILEAQKDLAASRTRVIAATADLNKSLVDLWLACGNLLESHGVELVDPAPPAKR